MNDFKAGKRPATIMHQIAKGYGDAEIARSPNTSRSSARRPP
jgi:cytochrome c553